MMKWIYDFDIVHTESFGIALYHSYIVTIFIVIGLIYRIVTDWTKNEQVQQKLRSEKVMAELTHLKSQVNPHFLFNTLNNLYYLCMKKDDIAPDVVMKLSELMRYVVSVGSKDVVSLNEELLNLESYIELEKLRLRTPDCVKYSATGEINHQPIAPLILLPFVENAFKHSKELIDEGLDIRIEVNERELQMTVVNRHNALDRPKREGVGLENVKRRLEITYPYNYQLEISDQSGIFSVCLKLKLNATKVYSH